LPETAKLRIGLQAGQQIGTNGGDSVVTAETLIQRGFGHVVSFELMQQVVNQLRLPA
jgi:NAD(P)H-hydrate repair Nnr-like enzyme with NAD(P)H-hydrate epimerase domain